MSRYLIVAGFMLAIVVLLVLLIRLVSDHKRRQTLRKMSLPTDAPLTQLQLRAFRAFEDTDMRLRKSFPGISDAQRQVIARDILRDKGLLPRGKKSAS
jgi:hypothetical protein